MPKRRIHGAELEVQDVGTGPAVCFSHGLLWDHHMFAPQIEALRSKYRCVAWDHRGQGQSEVPPTRSVTIEQVTSDAIALIEELGLAPVHFVGLSMGGFVGMRIAARRPELVRSLSLLETAADPEPPKHLPRYRLLALLARIFGMRGFLVDRVMKIMCAPSFLADPANQARVAELRAMMAGNDRSVVKAVYGVLEREGVEHELPQIRCPVLVLRGTEDKAIARERAHRLAELTKARWIEIPGAGHTSSLEKPEAVTSALQDFLDSVP
jgi:3-oxoadipate enol-lactonase